MSRPASDAANDFALIEAALQRAPHNLDWIATDGEPAMDALRRIRERIGGLHLAALAFTYTQDDDTRAELEAALARTDPRV